MKTSLGLDLGTSSLKMVLIDEKGNLLDSLSENYRISEPRPGYRQIDPGEWIAALQKGLLQFQERFSLQDIVSIGITGQMHTLVLLDRQMNAVGPALSWNDTRTADLLPELRQMIAERGHFLQLSCINTGSPAAGLYWLKKNEPEKIEKAYRFVMGSDYLSAWLTGNPGTDYCMASTSGLFDPETCEWDREGMEKMKLPVSLLPDVRYSAQCCGMIRAYAARTLGLSENVKIIQGTGDNPAAAFAASLFQSRKPMLSLGTSAVLQKVRPKPLAGKKGKNVLFYVDETERYCLCQGVVQSCGSTYSWICQDILKCEDMNLADRNIDPAVPGKMNLFFFPHMTGEKTLYADPELKGAFLGLAPDVKEQDMVRAVMEGIAFGIKQLMEAMDVTDPELIVCGGGSKSAKWCQILSDVLGRVLIRADVKTSPAAAMAKLAAGLPVTENITEGKRFIPSAGLRDFYENKYKIYRKIYPAIRSIR